MSLRVLSASHVAEVTSKFEPDELVNLMAEVFCRFSSGTDDPASSGIYQPHRITLPMQNHAALFMPSRISSVGTAMKVVSVPSAFAPLQVKARGLPASTLVLDAESAGVKAIVNARHLTALRNAAGSLLATRILLSNKEPQILLAIGAGAQISAHLALFLSSYPSFATCIVLNRSLNSRLHTLIASLKIRHPNVQFEIGTTTAGPSSSLLDSNANLCSAVQRADVIITATSSTTPFFPSAYVSPGAHLCLIGSYTPQMHEIDTDLVLRAGKVVVDSRSACLSEAGELIAAHRKPSDLAELGEIISITDTPNNSGRDVDPTDVPSWVPRDDLVQAIRASGDVTIFKSVGVGVQDVAIASAVVSFAERKDIGTVVNHYDDV
ncbi:NAD(P)-binding protein [Amylocystis lapponica]|nr:NAD(P)-binding protein [Amylocystis lapponica]